MAPAKGKREVRTYVWTNKPLHVCDHMGCLIDVLEADITILDYAKKTEYEVEYKGKKLKATFNVTNMAFNIKLPADA